MKNIRLVLTVGLLLVVMSACTRTVASQVDQMVVDPENPVLTLFYITKTKTSPDARVIPNCSGEYLIKVERSVWNKPSLKETMDDLFNSEMLADTGGYTADEIANKKLDVATTDDNVADSEIKYPLKVVHLTHSKDSVSDLCDASRAHEQITETVRAYSGANPFQISLDGTLKKWECFGNSASYCKK